MYNNYYGMDYKATKLVEVIYRFMDGEAKSTEYVYPAADYVNEKSAANALRTAAKRQRIGLKVSTRNGKVYMTKTI